MIANITKIIKKPRIKNSFYSQKYTTIHFFARKKIKSYENYMPNLEKML